MGWPVPLAKEIAERFAGTLEAGLQKARPLVSPLAISRAVRSARGVFAQIGRAYSLELREAHDHQAWWGRQYFPDTAEDEFVMRHAGIWDIERRPTLQARGTVVVTGSADAAIPAGTEFAAGDATQLVTTEVAVLAGAPPMADIPVIAAKAGIAGNLEAGIAVAPVLPNPDIASAVVGAEGMAGGAEIEPYEDVQHATMRHIRQRPHGGAGFDYFDWLDRAFDIRAVKVIPDWIGRGSVGVVVAMKDGASGRAPTLEEIEAMQIHLGRFQNPEGVRPVTAHVIVVACVVRPVAISLRLRPDADAARAAVTEAFNRFVLTLGDEEDTENESAIGATLEHSRISEAISGAAGEYAHDLTNPADGAPLVLERTEYPVAGDIDWLAPL